MHRKIDDFNRDAYVVFLTISLGFWLSTQTYAIVASHFLYLSYDTPCVIGTTSAFYWKQSGKL